MRMINFCLYVENSSDTSLRHGLYIFFKLRIGSYEDISLTNFVEKEPSNKIGISFLYFTINYEDIFNIRPP